MEQVASGQFMVLNSEEWSDFVVFATQKAVDMGLPPDSISDSLKGQIPDKFPCVVNYTISGDESHAIIDTKVSYRNNVNDFPHLTQHISRFKQISSEHEEFLGRTMNYIPDICVFHTFAMMSVLSQVNLSTSSWFQGNIVKYMDYDNENADECKSVSDHLDNIESSFEILNRIVRIGKCVVAYNIELSDTQLAASKFPIDIMETVRVSNSRDGEMVSDADAAIIWLCSMCADVKADIMDYYVNNDDTTLSLIEGHKWAHNKFMSEILHGPIQSDVMYPFVVILATILTEMLNDQNTLSLGGIL